MSKFATRLVEIRKSRGMLQEDLARELEVRQATVSGWERGVREPSLDLLCKIIISLECDANYLLGIID